MRTPTFFRRLALASMASAAFMASAQGVTEFPVLQRGTSSSPATEAAPVMKAPLNTEKPKGAYLFGSVLDDYDGFRNFASLHVNEPSNLTKLERICIPDPDNWMYERLFGLMAGCQGGDGYYYGYRLKIYSLVTYVSDFIKVNPYTGEIVESIRSYSDDPTLQGSLPFLYDMAYNPADGEVYGLATDPDSGDVAMSMLGIVDLKTGDFKKLCSLKRYYFGIAFDYDGKLYGVTWTYRAQGDGTSKISGTRLDEFDDEFEYKKGTALLVNESPFIPYYQHGLEFDYTTGDLYWAACDDSHNQVLVRVNPDNGKTENLGKIGYNEQILGLYIPFLTADSRRAPARVNGLSYAFDPQGANKTTLSWTNPSTQWNRKTLSDLGNVNIYRDDMKNAPVGTVSASGMEGKALSWTDESAERGLHKYYVVPVSVNGQKGVMDSISAFVGRDLPGSPVNVKASTPDGKTVVLKWEAPNRGDSDGWFDADAIKYTVTRDQDGKVIASDITEYSVTDKDIPEATTYTYSVVAKNNEGESVPGVSNGVLAGQSLKVPFYTDFPDELEAGRFDVIDGNADGRRFSYRFNTNKNGLFSYHLELAKGANDDYLVTPPVNVKEGHTYRVTFTVSVGRYGNYVDAWTQDFRIVGGTKGTVEGMDEEYADLREFVFDNIYDRKNVSAEFTADHDGDHFIALNVVTQNEDDAWLYVEECLIEEVFQNDLEAVLLDVPGIISNKDEKKDCPNVYNVTVSNPGMNPQKNYTIQVGFKTLSGDFVPLAETSQVETVGHNEKKVIMLNGTPDDVEDGEYQLVARVVLDGDEYAGNNESAAVPVKVDGNGALNFKVCVGETDPASYPPMNFYSPYSAYQTIYSPEMMNLKLQNDEDVAVVSRLVWNYEADKNISDTDVTIYLGQTQTKNINSKNTDWVVLNQKKVYEGKVSIKKGEGWLDIILDEGFEFDPEMSLVITMLKYNGAVAGEFPVRFKVFDYNQRHPDYYHSMGYSGMNPFDLNAFSSFTTYAYAQAPVVYMSVPGANIVETGVQGVENVEGVDFSYDNGVLSFSGIDVRTASVWSVDGKLVRNGAVAGGAVTLDVLPGIYVVKATAADGSVYTSKVRVSR